MDWIGPAISASAVILVAVIESVASRERKKAKVNYKKSEAVVTGVQSLLRDRIIQAYNQYAEQKFIPIYGMENVLDMYNAYHDLGGNGTVTKLIKTLQEMPTEPPA